MVTDHEKLVAFLSQKDCAFRGAWDILNGVLKVLSKNHIAYYLKEEGVCIEMQVNVPQREDPTPQRPEDF